MNNAMHSYKQAQVSTVSRADITLMLYDGAIRFLEQAHEKMLVRDMAAKGNLISRAIDIINELDSSLNMKQGGELSESLHKLYVLCTKNLLMANSRVDVEMLLSVKKNVERLRETFFEAMQTPEAKAMLAKMGPIQQGSTGSADNLRALGSIGQRAANIKRDDEYATKLIELKAKFDKATTDEEKAKAKVALDEHRATKAEAPKVTTLDDIANPAAAGMASRASRAFSQAAAQASGGITPPQNTQMPTQKMAFVSPFGQNGLQSPATQGASVQGTSTQGTPIAPTAPKMSSALTSPLAQNRTSAMYAKAGQTAPLTASTASLKQSVAPSMPKQGTNQAPLASPLNSMAQASMTQNVAAKATLMNTPTAQIPKPVAPTAPVAQVANMPQATAQSTLASPMASGGLMQKKMSLYKNVPNG